MRLERPMEIADGVWSTTTEVWAVLTASVEGDIDRVRSLAAKQPELIYAQYNYAPPIHFAVREGHVGLVKYLLDEGAHDPEYRIYPFLDPLETIAADRGFDEIADMLNGYAESPAKHKYKGDNGKIDYQRTELQTELEDAVDKSDLSKTAGILKQYPEFALDQTYFWSEGILTFAAKLNNREMADLLFSYGARVPDILKWAQFYYFERLDGAEYMIEHGMNPNTMSWQHVTVLHDMAQKGFIDKAALLIKHGADINPIDEAYQSTPLGMAARWGQTEMVEYLLANGADPNKAGAGWATPLAWALAKGHGDIAETLRQAGAVQVND